MRDSPRTEDRGARAVPRYGTRQRREGVDVPTDAVGGRGKWLMQQW